MTDIIWSLETKQTRESRRLYYFIRRMLLSGSMYLYWQRIKTEILELMWECPDFFELDGEYILLASPQDLCAGSEFHNGNNAVYYTGSYDRGRHVFDYSHVYSLDDGLDFYASQTMLSADGRRILIGWMQTWDANIRPADQKWACMMTIPRELRLDNGRILQSPVRELEKYYSNSVHYDQCTIKGTCQKEENPGTCAGYDCRTFGGRLYFV